MIFPDHQHVDYIHLKHFIPIPKQPDERNEDVDPCIFEGYLENEPEVYAVLTGGCPMEDSFEVFFLELMLFHDGYKHESLFSKLQFKSHHMNDFMFKVVDGIVNILQSPFQSETFEKTTMKIYVEALKIPDQKKYFTPRSTSFPTTGLV